MSKAKFTDDKWWVRVDSTTVKIGVSGSRTKISTRGTGSVFSEQEEKEANASLIETAPKLYRFLESLQLHVFDDYERDKLLAEARGEKL